jgi:hypothetical protein
MKIMSDSNYGKLAKAKTRRRNSFEMPTLKCVLLKLRLYWKLNN